MVQKKIQQILEVETLNMVVLPVVEAVLADKHMKLMMDKVEEVETQLASLVDLVAVVLLVVVQHLVDTEEMMQVVMEVLVDRVVTTMKVAADLQERVVLVTQVVLMVLSVHKVIMMREMELVDYCS